ncbi:uncharacterized protein IL334_000146 [Kwoniella shivajii]|uniref:Peroxin-14 n=1 Tax=Kwoniella shivajii TaxID=564305 RepID=A0ABZ1CNG9_9TREE|nr:hypothetical protein IL334_000146 [Kwoniella shivajii]
MLPTQPLNCGKRWWAPPDVNYNFNSRFAWPSPHPSVAEAAAASGAMGGAGAATGAAEGAAANFASHAAAGGAGGMPPRGPWGHQPHYYDGYSRYGRYGRRWGRRPGFGRLTWLLIGIGGTAWYFKHKEHRKEEFQKYLSDPSSVSQPDTQKNWGRQNHCRHRPLAASQQLADVNTSHNHSTIPTSFPEQSDEDKMAWGWGAWRERKAAREEAWRRSRQDKEQFPKEAVQTNMPQEKPQAKAAEMSATTMPTEGEEMSKIKEAVEKLWEEKKQDTFSAQAAANEKTKEYARQKLDKLSSAIEALKEWVKEEDAEKLQKAEKKWV